METKWLEDFVSLAETRSFSRSAQLRHVTQPAFSRRIQALEGWAGTDLVDRSSYPTRLTPAGQTLYGQAIEMLQALQSTRAMLRGHSAAAQDVIEFAVPHTLAFTFFPAWVTSLREQFGPIKSRLIALNVHDAVLRLVEGSCDLLIAYHHPSQPLPLDANRYEMVSLGQEVVAPWVKPDADGAPRYRLPGRPGQPLPYLGYAPGAYLGRVVDQLLKESEHRDPPRPRLRDRHGRRPQGDGARRPWHRLPAAERGAQGSARPHAGERAAARDRRASKRRWKSAPTASGPRRRRRRSPASRSAKSEAPARAPRARSRRCGPTSSEPSRALNEARLLVHCTNL